MSMSNIPENLNSITGLDREQVALLLLASIAFEELSLAHIMNAEGEKLQYALGTLENGGGLAEDLDLDGLLAVNRSVERMLRTVIKKEMLLQFKLEDILDSGLLNGNGPTPPPVFECACSAEALVNSQTETTTASFPEEELEDIEGNVAGQLRICADCEEDIRINYNFNAQGVNLQFDADVEELDEVDCDDIENGIVTVTGTGRATGTGFDQMNTPVNFTMVFDDDANIVTLTLTDIDTGDELYVGVTSAPVGVSPCIED
ncbi:hypothetical protein BpOF4_08740 [Alkalihalophilus pseudofirmus OF4]|uniref:Uncharacterized protein n=1 Tax=Alkalihalophilus pseudofirmus (strain ATCC BAA-2126 / JCM 17055 / OF4) TaxID=398511 RepID=D3FRP6_ALKPO|nr:hypothetical protein [Alkalihalophilus pseudofirmus]ADC49806.1 hypothetical protein BpOF4_08740 [Alkalihalophilus pseudofirmus OF4]